MRKKLLVVAPGNWGFAEGNHFLQVLTDAGFDAAVATGEEDQLRGQDYMLVLLGGDSHTVSLRRMGEAARRENVEILYMNTPLPDAKVIETLVAKIEECQPPLRAVG